MRSVNDRWMQSGGEIGNRCHELLCKHRPIRCARMTARSKPGRFDDWRWRLIGGTADIDDVALFLGSVFVAYDLVDDTRNRPRRGANNFNEIDGNGVGDFRMILDHRNAILWFAEITFKHTFRVRDGYDA